MLQKAKEIPPLTINSCIFFSSVKQTDKWLLNDFLFLQFLYHQIATCCYHWLSTSSSFFWVFNQQPSFSGLKKFCLKVYFKTTRKHCNEYSLKVFSVCLVKTLIYWLHLLWYTKIILTTLWVEHLLYAIHSNGH